MEQGWPAFPSIPDPVRGALVALRNAMIVRFGDRFLEARLFGSYARGEQHEESDVDVALLFGSPLSDVEADAIFDDVAPIDVRYQVWLMPKAFTREQFDRMLRKEQQLAVEIEREGIRI